MNSVSRIALNPTPEQAQRLLSLQRAFARVCNELAPIVQQTRTWNRVALHHIAYRKLREAFPELGSQMVCNAIYSVSRASRVVFQTPGSPFHHTKLVGRPLPKLHFSDNCPVYFDRHTLSLKDGRVSMYTLDGRMRFDLALTQGLEASFREAKLLEVSLQGSAQGFELLFVFGGAAAQAAPQASVGEAQATASVALYQRPTLASEPPAETAGAHTAAPLGALPLPHYLCVEEVS